MIRTALEAVFAVGGICGIGYYLLCLFSAYKFKNASSAKTSKGHPPITILKPLYGADLTTYENLRSHCLQNYPDYEIIFGVRNPHDPAVTEVRQLQEDFPERNIRLIICPQMCGSNPKVSNLIQMLPHAAHEYLIINDSDIRVPKDYLRRIVADLDDPRVGMVTCLYRGVPSNSLSSRLESVAISTDFCAGVLAAVQVESKMQFALGATLALNRTALTAIGGFEEIANYLADDFELGKRISAAGYQVLLSDMVVESFLPSYSFRQFLEHQLRWAISSRHSRNWGYAGVGLTFGLPWALFAGALSHMAGWSLIILLPAVILRHILAVYIGTGVLLDRQLLRRLLLVLPRDMLAVWIWIKSYTRDTVSWGGRTFLLQRGQLQWIAGLESAGAAQPVPLEGEVSEESFLMSRDMQT